MSSPPAMANANGKRPLSTIDSNGDPQPADAAPPLSTPVVNDTTVQVHTHEPSGYTWSKSEDGPGWAWTNKRAVEEVKRAWEGVLHEDRRLNNKYGDPFEMADSEAALLASQQQQQ